MVCVFELECQTFMQISHVCLLQKAPVQTSKNMTALMSLFEINVVPLLQSNPLPGEVVTHAGVRKQKQQPTTENNNSKLKSTCCLNSFNFYLQP